MKPRLTPAELQKVFDDLMGADRWHVGYDVEYPECVIGFGPDCLDDVMYEALCAIDDRGVRWCLNIVPDSTLDALHDVPLVEAFQQTWAACLATVRGGEWNTSPSPVPEN